MFEAEAISEALFPKSRRLVLGLLYGHPDERYYVRQIASLTSLGLGHVSGELERLTTGGLIARETEGRHVFYRARPECPIYKELRGIVAKSIGAGAQIKSALRPIANRISSAFIFGSVARSEENKNSDIDLIVVGDVSFGDVIEVIRPLEESLLREINPVVYSEKEFRDKILSESHFLTKVLDSPKEILIGDEHEFENMAQ